MQYNHRQRLHTSDIEYEIGAYGGEEVTPRNHHRPAQHLRNTEEAVIAQQLANQKRIDEARAREQKALANARQNRTTRNPASARRRAYTPTNRAYRNNEEDRDAKGGASPAQAVRSAVWYAPGHYIQGDTQWNGKQASPPGVRKQSPIPRRSSREA